MTQIRLENNISLTEVESITSRTLRPVAHYHIAEGSNANFQCQLESVCSSETSRQRSPWQQVSKSKKTEILKFRVRPCPRATETSISINHPIRLDVSHSRIQYLRIQRYQKVSPFTLRFLFNFNKSKGF